MAIADGGIMVFLQDVIKGADSKDLRALLEEAIKAPGPHHLASDSAQADPRVHVVLTTNDGATFLPKRGFITEHSALIHDLLAGADEEVIKEVVPLPNVAARELTRMLWLLQQHFNTTQLERCIAAFDIDSVVALQEAANFMDVRCITAACSGAIAGHVRKVADDEERTQLLELVTPPRLPQELCELWMERCSTKADELLKLLVKHPDQLLMPLAHWESAWADKGLFSEHRFNLSDEKELTMLKARSEAVKDSDGASLMKLKLYSGTTDDDMVHVKEHTQLVFLDLHDCTKITNAGLPHIKDLRQLTSLDIGVDLGSGNHISDAGLAHVKDLTQLTELDLGGCTLITDAGLAHVKELTQLTEVNLGGCWKITDMGLVHFKELTHLTCLNLAGCKKITDTGLAHIKVLKQLALLDLGGCNQITDTGLPHIKELPHLTSLNLEGWCKITDAGLVHVKDLTQLMELSLSECDQITDEGLSHVRELTQLTSLDLSGCDQIKNAGLAHVKELKRLTSLNLKSCDQITDTGLEHVKELAQLTSLSLLGCNKITDAGLAHVKELKQLVFLDLLGSYQITDAGLVYLKKLTQLTELHLSVCKQITDVGVAHIKELKQMTSLDLSRCDKITDAGLVHLKELVQLTKLYLRGCNLITDTGLVHIKELTQLTEVDLICCSITKQGKLFVRLLTADVDADGLTDNDAMWKLPDGTTLLHVAGQKNRREAVVALLGRGADVNAVDEKGRTPLQLAIEANAMDAM